MRAILMIVVLAIAVPDRPDPTPKTEKPPAEQILGDWLYAGNGKEPNPNPGAGNQVFRILADESIWIERGIPSAGNGFTAKVRFDWTKKPVTIDLMHSQGRAPILGIIRLEGDRFTMGWSDGGRRPLDFAGAQHIHHFIRIKK